MSPEPRTEWVPCGGSPHGATWVGLLDSGAACGRPSGVRGPTGRGSLLPAVAGVAAAERDVLHLEEVAAVLELGETAEEHQADRGGPACQTHLIRSTCSTLPSLLGAHTPTSGPPLRLSLTPRREISRSQEAGGRRWTVNFRAVAICSQGEGLRGLQASTSLLGEYSRLGLKSPGPDSGRCEHGLGHSLVSGWPAPSSSWPFPGLQPRAPHHPSREKTGAGLPCPLLLSSSVSGPADRQALLSVHRGNNEQANCILGGSDGKESACSAEDLGSIPGSGRSPGEGNGNPL